MFLVLLNFGADKVGVSLSLAFSAKPSDDLPSLPHSDGSLRNLPIVAQLLSNNAEASVRAG